MGITDDEEIRRLSEELERAIEQAAADDPALAETWEKVRDRGGAGSVEDDYELSQHFMRHPRLLAISEALAAASLEDHTDDTGPLS